MARKFIENDLKKIDKIVFEDFFSLILIKKNNFILIKKFN